MRTSFTKFLRMFRADLVKMDGRNTFEGRFFMALDNLIETIEGFNSANDVNDVDEQERKVTSNEIFGHSGAHISDHTTLAHSALYNFVRSIASDGVFDNLNEISRRMEFSPLALACLRSIDRELRERAVNILANHDPVLKTERELTHTISVLRQQLHWSAAHPQKAGPLHAAKAEEVLELADLGEVEDGY